ncbi:MAG TPA: tetratricopeptide repeat protein [Nitrospirales bacterium]|jgi:tetratricopeptide (TPR) repeat protein|nr:tetratricopeptide repeat protein [Nitrospirales bacterium]
MANDSASHAFMADAKELVEAGQFGKAIEVLQEGLKKFPKMVSARVMLGEVYWTSGDLTLARVELEQVIRAAPDNFAAYRKLAQVYHKLGDTASAVKACETILHANSKDREMGHLLEELQGGDKAAHAKQAKHPEKHEAPHMEDSTDSETLAELYISQGHREKGLEVYRRLAAKEPNNLRLHEKIMALEEEGAGASHAPAKASPETPDQAKRKARIRRLEGWLAVMRERRRT